MVIDGRALLAMVWLVIGLVALLRPEWFAALGGKPSSHVRTRPVRGWLTYGTHVRLVGAVIVLMALFVVAVPFVAER